MSQWYLTLGFLYPTGIINRFIFSSKRPLTDKELEDVAAHFWDDDDGEDLDNPLSDSGSEFLQSTDSDDSDVELLPKKQKRKRNDEEIEKEDTSVSSSDDISPGIILDKWRPVQTGFRPRKSVPVEKPCSILANLGRDSSELEVFFKLFPKSLFIWIAEKTNERINILQKKIKKPIRPTDQYEIMIIFGCYFIMSYNKVPAQYHYWSTNKSLGNTMIKQAISRNRFQLLSSKLYFNCPEKPPTASKVYYIEEVLSCLKKTFPQARSDSTFQSIDEAMAKFKGRSSLKQYLPLKPTKRGIKLWVRCDAKSGYTYDMNIYSGKDECRKDKELTLGEDVVFTLSKSIRDTDVSLCFDRFFTSTKIMNSLPFAAVGTAISTRKYMPKFEIRKNRSRGEAEFLCNQYGTCAVTWKDTKDVTILSNCHSNELTEIKRKAKDGLKYDVPCPKMVEHYNKYMGGVDLSDQMVGLYDMDRKTGKWWKRVFYRLLMTSAVNSWILYNELKRRNKRSSLEYLVPLAELLISYGREHANVVRKRQYGRPSLHAELKNVGDHLPVEGTSRRRCQNCTKKKKETRTKTLCVACDVPLCKNCFASYHT